MPRCAAVEAELGAAPVAVALEHAAGLTRQARRAVVRGGVDPQRVAAVGRRAEAEVGHARQGMLERQRVEAVGHLAGGVGQGSLGADAAPAARAGEGRDVGPEDGQADAGAPHADVLAEALLADFALARQMRPLVLLALLLGFLVALLVRLFSAFVLHLHVILASLFFAFVLLFVRLLVLFLFLRLLFLLFRLELVVVVSAALDFEKVDVEVADSAGPRLLGQLLAVGSQHHLSVPARTRQWSPGQPRRGNPPGRLPTLSRHEGQRRIVAGRHVGPRGQRNVPGRRPNEPGRRRLNVPERARRIGPRGRRCWSVVPARARRLKLGSGRRRGDVVPARRSCCLRFDSAHEGIKRVLFSRRRWRGGRGGGRGACRRCGGVGQPLLRCRRWRRDGGARGRRWCRLSAVPEVPHAGPRRRH